MTIHASARRLFREHFGADPSILVRSPGRVNIIGDHTDYNDGFVLPMAIDRAVWIAATPRQDDIVNVYASDLNESDHFTAASPQRRDGWRGYVEGVAHELSARGYRLSGWDGVIVSDVPIGAGLSSSAALEMAVARCFLATSREHWDPVEMAQLAQRVENDWVGVQCGIMDQLTSGSGVEGHALLIDCRSLEIRPIRLPADVRMIVLDTATRRDLVDSAYNERKASCESACSALGASALRDVGLRQLGSARELMDSMTFRRARHVIRENDAVLRVADALTRGDLREAGALMDESHESLRRDFEVSTPALDAMVDAAISSDACYGARLTGAGFGGAVVALVDGASTDTFVEGTLALYSASIGLPGRAIVVRAVPGTSCELMSMK